MGVDAIHGVWGYRRTQSSHFPPTLLLPPISRSFFTCSHSSCLCVPRRATPYALHLDDEDEGEVEPKSVLLIVAAAAMVLHSFWTREAPGGREGGREGRGGEGRILRAGGVTVSNPSRTRMTRESEAAAFGLGQCV